MAKYLIVNADDYGIAASVSQGIRESHQRGIVTSTTVMIGMDNAAEAVQQALKETPDLAALVLAAARNGGPGPLVAHFAGSVAGTLPCPLIIVPCGLDEEALQSPA